MAISTNEGGALVQGKGAPVAELIECVIAADCMGDGEIYLRGETRTVSKVVHRALVGAGRVCLDDDAAAAAIAELASRLPKAEEPKAEKSKGKAEA